MKYFDALKRKKVYVDEKNTKTFTYDIKSEDYMSLKLSEQIEVLEKLLMEKIVDIDNLGYANKIIINLEDKGEFIMDDESVFGMMSNIASIYSKLFVKQNEYVSAPKQKLLDDLPITPFVSYLLMSMYIVNKPIQIVINREHKESDSFEEVTLI